MSGLPVNGRAVFRPSSQTQSRLGQRRSAHIAGHARRADRPRLRPGSVHDPTPARNAGEAAESIPTGESVPRETHARRGVRHDRSCGDLRSWDGILAPCKSTGPDDRAGSPSTGIEQTPPPARETSRHARARVGAARPARADAVDRTMTRSPRHLWAQGTCPGVDSCGINELRGQRLRSIAETHGEGITGREPRSQPVARPCCRLSDFSPATTVSFTTAADTAQRRRGAEDLHHLVEGFQVRAADQVDAAGHGGDDAGHQTVAGSALRSTADRE